MRRDVTGREGEGAFPVVKVLKLVNRKVKGQTYYRWRLGDIPEATLKSLGWKEGDELELEVLGSALLVRRKK